MPKARIAGVGTIPVTRPGQSGDRDVTADRRQIDGMRLGLRHNLGLGGACVVTLYGKAA
jgi:hypothetical protein